MCSRMCCKCVHKAAAGCAARPLLDVACVTAGTMLRVLARKTGIRLSVDVSCGANVNLFCPLPSAAIVPYKGPWSPGVMDGERKKEKIVTKWGRVTSWIFF